ncbi:MAG TPA: tetratricopeptide repeat protein, partial [Salinivirgaceae bacterium]|nr:tetratricopeptide repeat protein [Salinivirgaceae bacterium]
SDAYIQMVQNRLNTSIYGDKTLTQLLERKLIRKIQENPNRDVFYELLLWNYLQDNDFANAYIQARALDFRKQTPGAKLLPLAMEATEAGDYATALKALDDIIGAGERSGYYIDASLQKLEVLYQRIKKGFDFTPENVKNTLDYYAKTLQSLGLSPTTFTIALQYCELLTHYGNRLNDAMQLLEQLEVLRGLTFEQRAQIELQKADIYLFQDKLWDAALIYAKIERQNKDNPIGSEAKFRKAKMAFYQHQFEWAKSQIDILKASTAKLTANDAVELSIHLYEGWSEIDSTQQELKTFATALLRHEQQRMAEALILLDSLSKSQNSYLAVEACNLKANILLNQQQHEQALEVLLQTISRYSFETNIDQTLFMAGVLMLEKNNQPSEGVKLLTRLLKNHPSSIYCIEARQKLQKSKIVP